MWSLVTRVIASPGHAGLGLQVTSQFFRFGTASNHCSPSAGTRPAASESFLPPGCPRAPLTMCQGLCDLRRRHKSTASPFPVDTPFLHQFVKRLPYSCVRLIPYSLMRLDSVGIGDPGVHSPVAILRSITSPP